MIEETYQLAYAPEAVADIRSIYAYIAFELGVPATAAKQVNRIRKMIKSLDFMPEKYVLIEKEPWKSKHTHKMSVDSYTVFYKVDKGTRNHASRDLIKVYLAKRERKLKTKIPNF